jgi:iron complex transport system substrate-binding protein
LRRLITYAVVLIAVAAWCGIGWTLNSLQAIPGAATATPQRIVSLTPDTTEILFALGLGEKVVGVSAYSDYPPEAAKKPVVGTYWEPDVEAVIALKPDLILGERSSKNGVLRRFERIGYRTASLKLDTIADLYAAITTVADCTGQVAEGQRLSADLRARFQAISDAVAGRPRPKVLWVVQAEPLRVAGQGTFVNEMIELAGGVNAVGRTSMAYPPVGVEQVLAAGVDVIIQPAMVGVTSIADQQAQALARWGDWPTIPAVRNKAIYVIPPDTVSRLGPRIPDGVGLVASLLHPECFPEKAKDSLK